MKTKTSLPLLHKLGFATLLSDSRDHKAVGRRPFDKMATLLAYLGPPEHKPVADTHWSSLNLTSSKFEEFMTRLGVFPGVKFVLFLMDKWSESFCFVL